MVNYLLGEALIKMGARPSRHDNRDSPRSRRDQMFIAYRFIKIQALRRSAILDPSRTTTFGSQREPGITGRLFDL